MYNAKKCLLQFLTLVLFLTVISSAACEELVVSDKEYISSFYNDNKLAIRDSIRFSGIVGKQYSSVRRIIDEGEALVYLGLRRSFWYDRITIDDDIGDTLLISESIPYCELYRDGTVVFYFTRIDVPLAKHFGIYYSPNMRPLCIGADYLLPEVEQMEDRRIELLNGHLEKTGEGWCSDRSKFNDSDAVLSRYYTYTEELDSGIFYFEFFE